MNAALTQTRVSFLFPDNKPNPTLEDYKQNLIDAENSSNMTLMEFNSKMEQWKIKNLKNN